MNLSLTVLGSGSSGNASLIHTPDCGILIDAGLSRKQILLRMDAAKLPHELIKGIILTHDHSDHIKGARLLADQLSIPTYLTSTIFTELSGKHQLGEKVCLFNPGTEFDIGPFTLTPFEIPHDTLQPVGFYITCGNKRIGFATDLGNIPHYVKSFLQGCNTIVLESDYDKKMLLETDRPLHLKRKIMGQFGHLDNHQVVEALSEIITPATTHIFLVHLSEHCNKEEIVYRMAKEKLEALHCDKLSLHVVGSSHCPYPTVDI